MPDPCVRLHHFGETLAGAASGPAVIDGHRMRRGFTAAFIVLSAFVTSAIAVTPDEALPDPGLELRARVISQDLRCVVCQNQSIDDSNAPLAHDLRVLLRERLTAGDSDQQAIDYIVARYGNFVLLKPPLQLNTLVLWFGPAFLVLVAAFGFGRYLRRQSVVRNSEAPAPLTSTEQARLDALLNEGSST
jgi:cytochrome c-type biogenesis protein CcmH